MEIYELIKVLISENRVNVLEELIRGKTKEQIRQQIPKSTLFHTLNSLKKAAFIEEVQGEPEITPKGYAYFKIFEKFKESFLTLERILEHFTEHIILFPDEFFARLHEIKDFRVVTSDYSDLLKPHRTFIENLTMSKEIYGVSSIFFPDYPQVFEVLDKKANIISLVVTEDVLNVISEHSPENYKNLELYLVDDNPQIAFAVTDRFLSIGFFYRSGSYDFTRDLISMTPSAIKFGKDLFEHYKNKARKVL